MAENPNPETGEVNLFDGTVAACPQPVYARMRGCPVSRAAFTGSPVISRYQDVLWALRHPEIFSSEMEVQMSLGTERPMIPQQIDPPDQTAYRKILDPRFSRRRMREIEPDVRRHANALIDAFIEEGACELNRAFAVPLPCTAFLRLLGLPLDQLDDYIDLKDGIIRPQTKTSDPEEVPRIRAETGRRIYASFEEVIDERTAAPGNDMVSYLLRAEMGDRRLTRNEILDICFLLLLGGLDTVTATIGCSVAHLAANPEARRRMARDPSLVPAAVEELLRHETPVMGVPRVVRRDVTISGVEIKAGELVTLMIGAANTDDAEFGDAGVSFERERNRHLAFGAGPHRCLGSHLARMEVRVALEELHRRIPEYAIAPGETPRYSPGIREVMYLPLVFEPGRREADAPA